MRRLIALMFCLGWMGLAAAAPASKDHFVLLDVQPAAEPLPALKYQLLPDVSEMEPGNAVPAFLKCFCEQTSFFFGKESVADRERLLKCPLSDIKPGSLKGYGGSALGQADYAARLEYCDWNILLQMRAKGYMLLLPEVQQMRLLANALAVRCRGQVADKDFDGAIGTLKTMFALARDMGDHPTIISGLVGVAIAGMGIDRLEELIQQPGAPNLYWALAALPNPLVEMRKGMLADRSLTEATFGVLLDGKRTWSDDDRAMATKKIKEFGAILELTPDERTAAEKWMLARLGDGEWLASARKELISSGAPADVVAKYPPEQVLFLDLYRKSRIHHDEAVKWIWLPYWQAEGELQELQKAPMGIEDKLTRQMVFAVAKVRAAHLRLEQRLALLRVVEAIRMDAAKNGGKLPAILNDVHSPLPVDPATGRSFVYKRDGMTGKVQGKTISTGSSTFTYAYEIRLRK